MISLADVGGNQRCPKGPNLQLGNAGLNLESSTFEGSMAICLSAEAESPRAAERFVDLRQRGLSLSESGFPVAVEWSEAVSLIAYGVHIGIRTNSRGLLRRCHCYLPVGWKLSSATVVDRLYSIVVSSPSDRGLKIRYQLLRGGRVILKSDDEAALLACLESDSSLFVADVSPRRVFVHAGVAGWKGKVILIPGRSHAGKSTLTAALIRAGASYYSDEFAVIDQDGLVYPYARPLQIRRPQDAHQLRIPVERLGGVAGHVPLPVGLIVLSQFEQGAVWRPRHLSPGEALLGILGNTVSARRAPAAAMHALKSVVSSGFAVKGTHGNAEEVVHWIARSFHREGESSPRRD